MSVNMPSPHGGNIYKASEVYGIRKEELLDYSANINPLGIPDCIRQGIIKGIDELVHYPDPDCTALRNEISRYLSVCEDRIIIGNGASEVIFLLFEILRPKKVLIPAPSFSEYASAAESAGVRVEYYRLQEQEEFQIHMKHFVESIEEDIEAVILCNPNNPTSTLIQQKDLIDLLEYAQGRNLFVILDEAFIELTRGGNANSMVEALKDYKNLFIIRAFTKLFAIPGLRLGYGLGNRELIQSMWRRKMPWSVNTFACGAGKVLSEGREYLEQTAHWFEQERAWFYHELSQIYGLKVFEPQTNFVLMKILSSDFDIKVLKDRMARKGVLIRDASNFVFLDSRFFRVAIKDRECNIKFLQILNEVLGELHTGGKDGREA